MRHITMPIAGMSCGSCVRTVAKALSAVPGVRVEAVTVGSATLTYDPKRTTPAAIAEAVQRAGYQPAPAGTRVPVAGGCCGGGSVGCCG